MLAIRQSSGVSQLGAKVENATKSPYLAELPELVWVGLQHCNTALMDQSRRRVPRLDLLPEDDLDVVCILRLD